MRGVSLSACSLFLVPPAFLIPPVANDGSWQSVPAAPGVAPPLPLALDAVSESLDLASRVEGIHMDWLLAGTVVPRLSVAPMDSFICLSVYLCRTHLH